MARRIDPPTLGALVCAGLALALLAPPFLRVLAEDAAPAPPSAPAAAGPLSTAWLGAGTPVLPAPVEGPACRPNATTPRTAATLAAVRARLTAEVATGGDGNAGDVVVLNNRGYNYGPGEVTDPSLLEFEVRKLSR